MFVIFHNSADVGLTQRTKDRRERERESKGKIVPVSNYFYYKTSEWAFTPLAFAPP